VTIHVLQGEREFASDNRTLGKFDLVGIRPAPRGAPRIEVTFDIDENGIFHVSAKDLDTGKEQRIRIESSSGLSDEEIEKMVKEAEANSEEDRKRKEAIELRNSADALVYSTEKSLKEHGEKLEASVKEEVESAISELRAALGGEDAAAIEAAMEKARSAAQRMGEAMYAQAQQGAQEPAGDEAAAGDADDETVEAEFTSAEGDDDTDGTKS
jgi:molecular chaperone DnaK